MNLELLVTSNDKKEDLRTKRTKKLLALSLLQLLQEKSLENISVADICKKSLLHRTSFYTHFEDKLELFEYIITIISGNIFNSALENKTFTSSMELYKYLIDISINIVDENKKAFASMVSKNNDELVVSIFAGTIKKEIEKLLNKNNDNLKIPVNIIAGFYSSGFLATLIWWISTPNKYSKEQLINFLDIIIDDKLKI
jgi:AcrR family transcriptional regulator